ncbi:MAG: peptidylprolyl isomerase [Rhodospirillales bacterium]|jgi:hypothetical protein|nr:peptidylprolyl isomerase [Rhodospirillales bacterium]
MSSWRREPLLHFTVLAGILFGLYQWVGPKPTNSAVIVVDAAVRNDMIDRFRKATQREPAPAELDHLIDGWIAKEVMYRQGLAMGLDRSDGRIREIVIANMHALVRAQSVPDAPPESELQKWFEQRRSNYDRPRTFDFVQVLFAGDDADAQARAQQARLTLASAANSEEAEPHLRPYRQRTREQVVKTYGEAFAAALERQPLGEWGVLRSMRGWHAVRLDAIAEPQAAVFETLKAQLENDWRREKEFELAAEMQRAMRASYTVERVDQP